MISVGIITAPRPKPTLDASVRSLRQDAGWKGEVCILSDGSIVAPDARCNVRRNVPPLGNLRNWVAALTWITHAAEEPWLMVCEDDIVWAKGAFSALERELKGCSFDAISLYLPIRMSKRLEEKVGPLDPGYHSDRMQVFRSMWGAQCLLLPRRTAVWLLSSRELRSFTHNFRWQKNVDGIVADCLNNTGRKIWWRVPCLVDHTPLGEGNSSLGYADDRPNLRTKYFTGQP
jgi:hypothetical protein